MSSSEPPLEFRNTVATAMLDLGRSEKRPFKAYVPLPNGPITDTLLTLKVAAAVVCNFRHTVTTFETVNANSAVNAAMNLYPFSAQLQNHQHEKTLPSAGLFWPGAVDRYNTTHTYWQDFFLTPSLVKPPLFWALPDCPLRLPQGLRDNLIDPLRETNLKEDRWFVCMDTGRRDHSDRPVGYDDHSYLKLCNFILDELGGQVVKTGYPGEIVWPSRPGFVDLSTGGRPLLLHALATSHARAFIGPGALGGTLAHILSIPSARTDTLDLFAGRPSDLVLTTNAVDREGTVRNQDALLDEGYTATEHFIHSLDSGNLTSVHPNSFDQLLSATQQILSETTDIAAWRPAQKPFIRDTGSFSWPPHSDLKPRFVDLSREAG